ncbi:MAG TPA: hypothetical protein VGH90_09155, partial [Chthoniobacteraceae bacterium]
MSQTFHFRLVELLRRRRELSQEEVTVLLDALPAMLDDSPPLPGTYLNMVGVQFLALGAGANTDELLKTDVTKWPKFELLLLAENPEDTEAGGMLVTTSDTSVLQSENTTARFGALLYELLGGSRRDAWGAVQFSPLPHLDEQPNDLLHAAFEDESVNQCRAFWQNWKRAVGQIESAPPVATAPPAEKPAAAEVKEWRIPRWLLGNAQPGEVLELTPVEEDRPSVRLSARSEFKIGRSRALSDFPVRCAEGSAGSGDEVKELSRVHVLMELCASGLTFRDGNGEKRSTNGSSFGGEPLDAKRPTFLYGRDVLTLSDTYRLEVAPVLQRQKTTFEPVNLHEWKGSSESFANRWPISGAVFFLPLDRHPVVRDAVWLLSEIGFRLTGDDHHIAWVDYEGLAKGWWLHRGGCFWLANSSLDEGEARIEDGVLELGQIAPLVNGQRLELGGRQFKVAV